MHIPAPTMERLLERQKAGRRAKKKLQTQTAQEALKREPPGTLRMQACTVQPRVYLGMVVANRADALLLANEYLEYNWALRRRYEKHILTVQ